MPRITYKGKSLRNINGNIPPVFNDWFLPVQSELSTMGNNLKDFDIGDFNYNTYWASREGISTTASNWSFTSGSSAPKGNVYGVRAMRIFNAPENTYSLRDVGPAGGWIFYINNTIYYEASPTDLGSSVWSNITNQFAGANSSTNGEFNTLAIINQPGHTTSAALLCHQLVTYGSL
jgi:hypothetical protein